MGHFLRLRTATLVLATIICLEIVVLVLLCLPVVHIDPSTCDQILPGMSFEQVQALTGGPPGWYDGVRGIVTSAPEYKGTNPVNWTGSNWQLVVRLDGERRVVEARFYPAKGVQFSITKFAWERVTRNAFGAGRINEVNDMGSGLVLGLLIAIPTAFAAVYSWKLGHPKGAYAVCVISALASLALLVFAIDIAAHDGDFLPLGGSSSALVTFLIGSVLTGRRRRAA
jgi:hypothetical protein